MDGIELINTINDLQRELDQTIKHLNRTGIHYAMADANYRAAVRVAMLRLRESGTPVTIIRDIVLGEVADLRQAMNIAEANYKTAQEKIQAIKLQMRLIDNQIAREYGN